MQVKAHGRGLRVQSKAMGARAVRQWASVGRPLHARVSAGGVRAGCGARRKPMRLQWGVRVGCRARDACASVGIRLRGVRAWLVSGR